METVVLVIAGLAVSGYIIWRMVKSSRNPSCDCGCSGAKKNNCAACRTKTTTLNSLNKPQ